MVSLSRTFPTSDNSFLLLDDSWERLHASPTNRRFPHQPFNKSIDFPKKHPRLHKSKRCKKQMFFVGTPNHFAWFFPNQPKTTKATDLVLKRLAFPRTRSPAISREIEVSEISKFGPDIMGIYTSEDQHETPQSGGLAQMFFSPGWRFRFYVSSLGALGLALAWCSAARTWRKVKGRREQSKADQVGVEPPQKVVKAREALQKATPHPMGNWSSATSGGFAWFHADSTAAAPPRRDMVYWGNAKGPVRGHWE